MLEKERKNAHNEGTYIYAIFRIWRERGRERGNCDTTMAIKKEAYFHSGTGRGWKRGGKRKHQQKLNKTETKQSSEKA